MIYIARDGAQQGPFSIEQINAMLASGQLRPADHAWWEGCTEWVPLQKAPGVALPAAAAAVPAPAVPASVYAPPRGAIAPGGSFTAQVSPGSIQALRETRPWVLLLAVLGLIGTGLMLLAGVAMAVMGAGFGASMPSSPAMPGFGGTGFFVGIGILYLIMALLYFYPILKLLKFSGAISRLNRSGALADLEEALRQQKSFWKFIGILAVVMIVLYVVAAIVVGAGAFSAASSVRRSLPPGPPVTVPAIPSAP